MRSGSVRGNVMSQDAWKTLKFARSEHQLQTNDVISRVFDSFVELKGDRVQGDCPSIISGLAALDGMSVMVMGQAKGRTLDDRLKRNFGMTQPSGFRKCARLMRMAEKFSLPILCLIDTPGAAVDIEAETNNQSGAISHSLTTMLAVKVPIISLVLGEGMSGGGLALALADELWMLRHSVFSVISPEGCASILFKSAEKAQTIAPFMQMTPDKLLSMKLIDRIIEDDDQTQLITELKQSLKHNFKFLQQMNPEQLLLKRRNQWSMRRLDHVLAD